LEIAALARENISVYNGSCLKCDFQVRGQTPFKIKTKPPLESGGFIALAFSLVTP